MLTMNKLNANKLISTIYVVGVLCFLLSSGHAFAQKNKESNSSINIDRIRFMTSNNSLAEEAPNIYVSNYDLVSGYEKVNRAHRSLTYVSGWLFDLGLG